jgi:hypothetical protein
MKATAICSAVIVLAMAIVTALLLQRARRCAESDYRR